jgi:N-acetylneuraminate synthase/N,N'-diacetyllegionaminate synthase
MKKLTIGNRAIGEGHPTVVIAEIGVNHDGSLQRAIELARIAKECGADAVKLQIFRADRLMHASSAFAAYQQCACADASPAEMLRRYELSDADVAGVVAAIRDLGLVPLATPFSPDDVAAIEALSLPAIKIASPDLVNRPLLMRAVRSGRPMLLSCGAATLAEMDSASEWLTDQSASVALLHCVSSYPVPLELAHLAWIEEMRLRYELPIGYSDHTTEALAGAFAVSAGACIVEKHLTFDRAAPGPDHAASADPQQFDEYVKMIRRAERMRGVGGKVVLEIERDVRRVSRQSLVLRRAIAEGDPIGADDLTVQRPGTGICASSIDTAIGRRARRSLPAGTLLTWDMLTDAA